MVQQISSDALIATPTVQAHLIMQAMIAERVRGRWKSRWSRREFWAFGLSRLGSHTHIEMADILSLPPEEVKQLLFLLMIKDLVVLRTASGREITMNAALLSESFERIKVHGMQFATSFYNRLFQLAQEQVMALEMEAAGTLSPERAAEIERDLAFYRSVKQLFIHTSMQEQCQALLGTLAVVIAGVTQNKDIRKTLANLGKRHVTYGVLPGHYPLVGQALIETLRSDFGKEWNDELLHTWQDAYDIISTIMIEAAYPAE